MHGPQILVSDTPHAIEVTLARRLFCSNRGSILHPIMQSCYCCERPRDDGWPTEGENVGRRPLVRPKVAGCSQGSRVGERCSALVRCLQSARSDGPANGPACEAVCGCNDRNLLQSAPSGSTCTSTQVLGKGRTTATYREHWEKMARIEYHRHLDGPCTT